LNQTVLGVLATLWSGFIDRPAGDKGIQEAVTIQVTQSYRAAACLRLKAAALFKTAFTIAKPDGRPPEVVVDIQAGTMNPPQQVAPKMSRIPSPSKISQGYG
jgi:hypothetical protein